MDKGLLNAPPFDKIHGLENAKTAILCMAVDDNIRSLLIRGPSGVGKTALVRSAIEPILGRKLTNIPQNTTDEHLFGSLDIDAAIEDGQKRFKKGLLGRTDDGVLYIDDLNRFDKRMLRVLMESISEGNVRVERDGLSAEYQCDAAIVASMNTNEAPISRNLSDRFDISVTIQSSKDPDFRSDVVKTEIKDEDGDEDDALLKKISRAKELLPSVVMPDRLLESVVKICSDWGVDSYRGEISVIRVSKVLAALDNRALVVMEDLAGAALLGLDHRRDRVYIPTKKEKEQVNFHSESHIRRFIHDERKTKDDDVVSAKSTVDVVVDVESVPNDGYELSSDEVYTKIGELFKTVDIKEAVLRELEGPEMVRRSAKEDNKEGKFVSVESMKRPSDDIAFYATVRRAAPFQKIRQEGHGGGRFLIEKDDLMRKIYEKRITSTYLFVIDNSGSLVIRGRMRAVKAAILSMLADHYERKDSVGIMTFNEKYVGLVMPPVRSPGGVKKVLEDMTVGNKTPLSESLTFVNDYMLQYTRKHPSERCYIIMMTDAKANMSISGDGNPFDEALKVAGRMNIPNTRWILVDTSTDTDDQDRAYRLSRSLRSLYYRLDELHSSEGLIARREIGLQPPTDPRSVRN